LSVSEFIQVSPFDTVILTVLQTCSVIDFSPILKANPNLLSLLHSKEPQGEGAMGKVYKVQLSNENEWQLQAGDYAFKLSKATRWNIQTEVISNLFDI